MQELNGRYPSETGQNVFYRIWEPEFKPIAVLQIIHGMGEHSERYSELAEYMCKQGFVVAAEDHAGHGITGYDSSKSMYFDEKEGWIKVAKDIKKFNSQLKTSYHNLPLIILGHSMGSFFARYFMIKEPDLADRWILSGTANFTLAERIGGFALTNISLFFKDAEKEAGFIHKLGFDSYNNKFKNEDSDFAWLSTDKKVVEAYEKDPMCGAVGTGAFYRDLFYGINVIQKEKELQKMEKTATVLFIAGENDPVGNYGKGVKKVIAKFEKLGLRPEFSIFKNMRHEILNDANREIAWNVVLDFCKKAL